MLALMIRKVLIMLSIYPNFHTQALLPATVYISGFWSSFGKYTIVKLLLQKLLQNSKCLKQGDEPLHSVNNDKWTGFRKSRCQEGRQWWWRWCWRLRWKVDSDSGRSAIVPLNLSFFRCKETFEWRSISARVNIHYWSWTQRWGGWIVNMSTQSSLCPFVSMWKYKNCIQFPWFYLKTPSLYSTPERPIGQGHQA